MKKMSFFMAMMDFFGKLPEQSATQFAAEVKTAGEREFYLAGLIANGYEIVAAS